jgi:hypothetical protein
MEDNTDFKTIETCRACGHMRHCGYSCFDKVTNDCVCEECQCDTCLAPNERIGPTDI